MSYDAVRAFAHADVRETLENRVGPRTADAILDAIDARIADARGERRLTSFITTDLGDITDALDAVCTEWRTPGPDYSIIDDAVAAIRTLAAERDEARGSGEKRFTLLCAAVDRAEKAKEQRRMADPVKHADRLEYKRLARKLMPQKVAGYKKLYAARHAEKVRAYHEAYRAQHLEARRERERLRHRNALPVRCCLACSTIITGRAKKCDDCKRSERTTARQLISQRPGMAA